MSLTTTSDWFQSQLPPAAEQPEAKIELSSIEDEPLSTPPAMPAVPPLSQVTAEVTQQPPSSSGQSPDQAYPGR